MTTEIRHKIGPQKRFKNQKNKIKTSFFVCAYIYLLKNNLFKSILKEKKKYFWNKIKITTITVNVDYANFLKQSLFEFQ